MAYKDLNDSEVLIFFKLTVLSRSRSKRIIFLLSQLGCRWRTFRSLFENYVYKKPCFKRKIKSKIKLNSEKFVLTC